MEEVKNCCENFLLIILSFFVRNAVKLFHLVYLIFYKIFTCCSCCTDWKMVICKLPDQFGKNALLLSAANSFSSGIFPIYLSHAKSFCGLFPWTQNDVIRALRTYLNESSYIGTEEIISLYFVGTAHSWSIIDYAGNQKQLITILKKDDNGNYELIDACIRKSKRYNYITGK